MTGSEKNIKQQINFVTSHISLTNLLSQYVLNFVIHTLNTRINCHHMNLLPVLKDKVNRSIWI